MKKQNQYLQELEKIHLTGQKPWRTAIAVLISLVIFVSLFSLAVPEMRAADRLFESLFAGAYSTVSSPTVKEGLVCRPS